MKKIKKYYERKISYKAIDDFVDKTRAALDPDDDFYIEWHIQEDYQFISVNVVDRVLHWWKKKKLISQDFEKLSNTFIITLALITL